MTIRRRVRITRTIQFKASAEDAFRIISDPEYILKSKLLPNEHDDRENFAVQVHSVERITKGLVGKGSVWHFKGSFHRIPVEYDAQVTVWDPPRRLVTKQVGGGPFKAIQWEHRLTKVKSRSVTKETFMVRYDIPNSLRIDGEKDPRRRLGKSMEIALARLKRFLEEGKKVDTDTH